MAGVNEAGRLEITVAARLDELQRGMKQAESIAKDSGQKIGKAMDAGFKAAAIFGALGTITAGIKLADAATKAWNGNLTEAAAVMETLPLGIGQLARAAGDLYLNLSGLEKGLDTARSQLDKSKVDLATAKQGASLLAGLEQELKLANAGSDKERSEIKIELDFEKIKTIAEQLGRRGQGDLIVEVADKLRQKRLADLDKVSEKTANFAEVSALSSFSLPAPNKDQPKAKQIDLTNQILQNIVRVIAAQENSATAQ